METARLAEEAARVAGTDWDAVRTALNGIAVDALPTPEDRHFAEMLQLDFLTGKELRPLTQMRSFQADRLLTLYATQQCPAVAP